MAFYMATYNPSSNEVRRFCVYCKSLQQNGTYDPDAGWGAIIYSYLCPKEFQRKISVSHGTHTVFLRSLW